jgi:hypothetical protein
MSTFLNRFMKPSSVRSLWFAHILIIAFAVLATRGMADSSTPSQTDAPGECRVLSERSIITFPFDVFRGDIRFQCEVNGHTVKMLLDDGYMWDELLFWGSPRVDSLGLEYDGSIEVGGGSADAEKIISKTASGITVRFPNVEFTEQKAVITPASSGTGSMWMGSEGQISAMFFKHFVVDINFDKMMITLIKPEDFKYQGEGTAVAWKPMEFGAWSIPATLDLVDGREISLNLLMDLGYNDRLQIWAGKENNISAPDKVLPADLGRNIQGVQTRGYVGRMPRIVIGGYEIKDVLVAYVSAEDSKQAMAEAMIGLGLLSRFNLIYDYSRQRLIVKPNSTFDDAFDYDMSGLSMQKKPDGFLEIVRIYDNSPASDAGLKTGDRVISINGKPAVDFDIFERESLFSQEGKTIRLFVRRDGREWEVSLVLRRLI